MSTVKTLLSTIRLGRAQQNQPLSQASFWARSRFRSSMLGEPGIHEAVRLFGIGR